MNTQQYSFSCVNKPQSFIDLSRSCETHPLATTIHVSRPSPKTHLLTTTIHGPSLPIHGSCIPDYNSHPFSNLYIPSYNHSRTSIAHGKVGTSTLVSTSYNNNWLTICDSQSFMKN